MEDDEWEAFANADTRDTRDTTTTTTTPTSRPLTTDKVASRIISNALGVRPPKRTPQQEAYDKLVKQNVEKARKLTAEQKAKTKKAQLEIWQD